MDSETAFPETGKLMVRFKVSETGNRKRLANGGSTMEIITEKTITNLFKPKCVLLLKKSQ